MKYNVAIIGGGPAGYTAAERAGAEGLSVILFEKNALGGVCLNEGCVPTKTLLYSAKVYDMLKGSSKYGIDSETASLDIAKVIARKNKVVRKLVAGIKMKMTENGVTVINGEARILGRSSEGIGIVCNGENYYAERLIICTGSESVVPPIKGLSDSAYWTSREALQSKDEISSIIIIGGGVIGMEFASFFNSLGASVEVVEMAHEILPGIDKEIAAFLRLEYEKRGIVFHLGCTVTEVDGTKVTVERDGKQIDIEAQKILLSTGRRPVTTGFGLEMLNLEMNRGGVKVDAYMQTSCAGVYACGDITGFSLLAHTAVSEAETAIRHICGKPRPMSYRSVPGVVYTNPEVAGVGATEKQLQEEGRKHTVKKLPMSYSGRFVAENEMSSGLCKMLVDEDGVILGVHLLGNPASELIVTAGIAIEEGWTAERLAAFVFPHPTVGEILKETALHKPA